MDSHDVGIFVLGCWRCQFLQQGSLWALMMLIVFLEFSASRHCELAWKFPFIGSAPRSFQNPWFKTTTWEHLGGKGKWDLPVYYWFNHDFYGKVITCRTLSYDFSWLGLSMPACPYNSHKQRFMMEMDAGLFVVTCFPRTQSVKVRSCQSCWRFSFSSGRAFGWKKVRTPELSPHVRVENNHATKRSHKPFFFLFFFFLKRNGCTWPFFL